MTESELYGLNETTSKTNWSGKAGLSHSIFWIRREEGRLLLRVDEYRKILSVWMRCSD